MKKIIQKLLSAILAAAMLFTLAACNSEGEAVEETAEETAETTPEPVEAVEVIEEEPEPEPLSESDLLPFIQFCDLYVTQRDEAAFEDEAGAEVYDPLGYLLTPVIYDDTVVLSIAFDGTAVDVTVPGDYDITFTVTIDRNAYDAALLAPGTSAEANIEASSEPVTEEVIITKTVHIVTAEDYAAALADGTISEVVEGTAIVVVEDEVDEVAVEEDSDEEDGEDADDPGDSDDDSQDNDTTNSTDNKSDSDNTSTNNDSDTSNVTATSSPTSAPATSTGSGTSTSSGSATSGSTSSGSTSSGSSSGSTSTGSSSSSSSSGTTNTGSTSSGSTSSGSTSSGSTSSGTSTSTATATPAPTASATSGSSSSSGSTSSGSTSSGTSSSTATATPAPTATTHVHTWVTETVESGYYEQVQTGTEKVYNYDDATWVEGYYMCLTCGYTSTSGNDIGYHVATVCGGGYTYIDSHYENLLIEYVPIYENIWVDTSYTITYCSECGATQ